MVERSDNSPVMDSKLKQARKKAASLKLDQIRHTLIVCMDRKTAKCCSSRTMDAAWKQLKTRCKEWRKSGRPPILRIKSGCIGVCKAGPIIGVLPDGVWYGGCTADVIDRIFDEHLATGQIVHDHVIANVAPNA